MPLVRGAPYSHQGVHLYPQSCPKRLHVEACGFQKRPQRAQCEGLGPLKWCQRASFEGFGVQRCPLQKLNFYDTEAQN